VLHNDLVLKSAECYLVGATPSDGTGEPATGLYLRDTRHLSRFATTLNGLPPRSLTVRTLAADHARIIAGNLPFKASGGPFVPSQTIAVEQDVRLGGALTVRTTLRNHGLEPLALVLRLDLGSDFRDLFDLRGFDRARRGDLLPPTIDGDTVTLRYRGLDGAEVATTITFDQPATIDAVAPDDRSPILGGAPPSAADGAVPPVGTPVTAVSAAFELRLAPREAWALGVVLSPRPAGLASTSERPAAAGGGLPRQATITTNDPRLDRVLAQANDDLAMLQTTFPEGSLPAAGIPWYVAPFGRDSLIVGLQTLPLAPARAADILRVLAAHQGNRVDPWRDEEPGKILHEVRYGELARLGEIPHTPYYGTVDATPLFVLLFAETVAWTRDEGLYQELLPAVRRALDWIERYGDGDGDGLVEYRHRAPDGVHISHQGWKDSADSLHHADGTPATGLIALVEVQGYAFAAYDRLAAVAAARGDTVWAGELHSKADAVRRAVEDRFWLEDEGFYAQALDGDKRPVRTISSNPGHLLFCGLPAADRADRLAARFRRPDLDSGWGLRTLSTAAASYNPMSYHNGSVWPHDNSLIGAGLARYGHHADAARILEALLAVAASDPSARLPELYCGYPRTDESREAPVPYPVSCTPQAWAAAAIPLLVTSLLGLSVDPASGALTAAPSLPPWLDRVEVSGIEAGGTATRVRINGPEERAEITRDAAATAPILR
jgi:glycogen debranching enzyme